MIAALALMAALPADVSAFAERFEQCVRLVGEEIEAAERVREIEQEGRALSCDRLDRDEAGLRRRYAKQPEVIARLDALRAVD